MRLGPNLRWLKDDVIGDLDDVLRVLMATIGMLLLVACANVANRGAKRAGRSLRSEPRWAPDGSHLALFSMETKDLIGKRDGEERYYNSIRY